MTRYKNINQELVNPINQLPIDVEKKHQPDGSKVNFFNDIPDLYLPDGNALTEKQSDFYQDVKFPNYDDYDDFGTLIDKAEKGIFAHKLDQCIPWGCSILEAGCGTGQLSLFLSRANRKVIGIDLVKRFIIEGENSEKKTK